MLFRSLLAAGFCLLLLVLLLLLILLAAGGCCFLIVDCGLLFAGSAFAADVEDDDDVEVAGAAGCWLLAAGCSLLPLAIDFLRILLADGGFCLSVGDSWSEVAAGAAVAEEEDDDEVVDGDAAGCWELAAGCSCWMVGACCCGLYERRGA